MKLCLYSRIAIIVDEEKIPQIEKTVQTFMPSIERHFLTPFWSIDKLYMNSGKDPCGIVPYQVIIAETEVHCMTASSLLCQVHERCWLETPRRIRIVAGNYMFFSIFYHLTVCG